MRILFFCSCFLIISCSDFKNKQKSNRTSQKTIVVFQPLQNFSKAMALYLKDSIEKFYPVKVYISRVRTFPINAYYQPRSRYRADTTIAWLKTIKTDSVQLIVGLTDEDISTSKNDINDYGVMGLGYHPGSACIVSSYRPKKSAKSTRQLQERMFKLVAHEMGHNFGLPHCSNESCIMVDAEGKMKLDDEKGLCSDCLKKIQSNSFSQ